MKQRNSYFVMACLFYLPTSFLCTTGKAADFENNDVWIRFKARTPQQMAAFYEARGFPRAMINILNEVCFFTIGIKNKTKDILWHDLTDWKFTAAGKAIARFDRKYWKKQWQTMQIPMASQSTFRWTLLPEQLDFRPNESEGGNITLPRGPLTYDIKATFKTGKDKNGPILSVQLRDIRCAEDKG